MPRPLRVEYPGAIYHLMSRGDHRESIFRDDADRRTFMSTLGEACAKTGWQVHAWCLMGNHFHLVAETPQPNLVAGMKWLLGTYTGRFNRRHKLFGHLFSGRYKSLIIDERGGGYLRTACDYVHLNPVRAGLVALDAPLSAYAWSSYPLYLAPGGRPGGIVGRLSAGLAAECGGFRTTSRRAAGACGSSARVGAGTQGNRRATCGTIRPGMVGNGGWSQAELHTRSKGDPKKTQWALRLREETPMTRQWIATPLGMGSASYISHLTANGKDCRL